MLDERIDEDAVLAEAVVEMRASCGSRRTNAADQFSLIDVSAGANSSRERRKMEIVGLKSACVAETHHIATATAPARRENSARCNRDHRRANRRRIVDAQMSTIRTEHRMETVA